MIQTLTLELSKAAKDEMRALSALLPLLLKEKRYDEAKALVARHDALTHDAPTKLYDQSEDQREQP